MIQSCNQYRGALLLVAPLLMTFSLIANAAQPVQGNYVTTSAVQLRKGPGTNYEIITTIPKGVNVAVVAKEGNWLKVESKHGGETGYISEQYAQPVAIQGAQAKTTPLSSAGTYRTVRETELREGPAPTSRIITRLPANIKVHVVRSEGNWLRVESKHGDKPGYVETQAVEPWRNR